MKKVLVDSGQFIGELVIEQLDDMGITFHGGPLYVVLDTLL
jgi:hypothetical protein